MDKEKESRDRDLKKNGARFFSSSSSSPSPSGSNINCNGRGGYAFAMESSRKEKAKGLKRSCSDDKEERGADGKCNGGSKREEGNIFCPPPNANCSSSRKRVKLQGKVADDCCPDRPVDPPLVVPKTAKRLRSAINKRTSQSASPPKSDSKRREHNAYDRTQLFNRSNGEKIEQKMPEEPTKDEEEVAETLICIASLITVSKPAEAKDGKFLQENSETKATLVSLVGDEFSDLKASSGECTKFLVPCNGTAASNPIPCADDPSTPEQATDTSVGQRLSAAANGTSQHEPCVTLSSNVQPEEGVTPFTDTMKLSSPLGTSLYHLPQNGMLQPRQSDAHLLRKQENGPWPKPEIVAQDASRKASNVQPGLPGKGHEQMSMSYSGEVVIYPNSVAISGKPGSSNGLPNEKSRSMARTEAVDACMRCGPVFIDQLSLSPADKEWQWNRCRTHVCICHLIQNHKKAENNQLSESKDRQSKVKEGANRSVPTSSETNGSKSVLEARNHMLQDVRLLQAQQAAMLSGAYALQKQAVVETKTSGDENKPGQFPVPCPPNQLYMPFTFSRCSYTRYQEQLTAGASQQVQLQLPPPCLATGQLHGSHRDHAAAAAGSTPTKQQQQQQLMWQAHLAHYWPPVGFPPNWQQNNGRPQGSSSSQSSLISQSPAIFPLPTDLNPQNLHQTFILPLPSSLQSLK